MEELEDAVVVFDRDLAVLDANHAALAYSEMSLSEVRGQSARDLMSADSFQAVSSFLPLLLERGSARGLVIDARTRHGWVKLEVSARVSEDRQVIVCIGRDIGQHLELERELAERNRQLAEQNERIAAADRLKSEFLANVSHELTTPLTCIKGFTKLLLGDLEAELRGREARISAAKRVEFLRVMQRESERTGDLIRGLLELSKIESGVVTLDRARVWLNTIVRETLLLLKPRLDERSLEVEQRLDESLPPAFLDPDRMKQVVLNLIDNAIKFSEPRSSLSIQTSHSGGCLRLVVRNPSGELGERDLARIFERFVQRDGSFSRSHGGVGLGLNLVRAIVELHGGRVWARLPEPGWVEFVAEIPVASA
jgi:PAS domain S-box-containing protein